MSKKGSQFNTLNQNSKNDDPVMLRLRKYLEKKEPGINLNEFIRENQGKIMILKKNEGLDKEFQFHFALGQKTRFMIYQVLKHKPSSTCALAVLFKMKENTINHHLKVLENAGLIYSQYEGYFTVYYINQIINK